MCVCVRERERKLAYDYFQHILLVKASYWALLVRDRERLRLNDVIRFAVLKALSGKSGYRKTKWEGVVIVQVKDDILS